MSGTPASAVDIGIIGAEVGALTLALACRLQGLICTVYETPATHALIDPVIELTANATRVLHSLGLREALATAALEPMYSLTRTGRGGLLLNQRPLGPFSAARYGATCHLAAQSQLIRLLRTACASEDVVIEAVNSPIIGIEEESGVIRFTDGGLRRHDIIAQAVPLPDLSQTRASTDPDADPSGDVALPRSAMPSFTVLRADSTRAGNPKVVQIWSAAGVCGIEYPHGTGCQLLAMISEPHVDSDPETLLHDRLSDLHPQLQKLADGLCNVSLIAGCNAAPLSHWFHHRHVLLGEACHRLPAYATQRSAMAIEDAWVLAIMMERWESTPEKGFPDYQRFRRPRVMKIRDHALRQAQQLTLSDPSEVWLRNFRLSMTSRFLPEISIAKDDWLFGYDCIKGFI